MYIHYDLKRIKDTINILVMETQRDELKQSIEVVKYIRQDIDAGLGMEATRAKWSSFSIQQPKVFTLAVGDPDCIAKLEKMLELMESKIEGTMNQHEASVVFGQVIADEYLPKPKKR